MICKKLKSTQIAINNNCQPRIVDEVLNSVMKLENNIKAVTNVGKDKYS